MKVHIITVGDEILIGQVVDTNAAWMAQQLNLIGARVIRKITVGDVHDEMVSAIRNAFESAEVVLMTGGLGPTKDDITKKAIADFFGVDMVFHQETYDRIVALFDARNISLKPSHRAQCYMPANAQLLFNKMGTAPGMWFEYNGKVLIAMPGVPYEMEYVMAHEAIPRLKAYFPGELIAHRTILTVGKGETDIASMIEPVENSLPSNVKLAYLPALGQVRLRLTGIGGDEQSLNKILDEKAAEIEAILADIVYGRDDQQLEAVIGRMLLANNLLLGTAESCTGGYIAHRLTSIPGASAYFKGSIISYANEIKVDNLGVHPTTLQEQGAVSEQTVKEMVEGALKALKADIAIAVSGIAGPDGGTPDKPVGTVWIAVGNHQQIKTRKIFTGRTDRLKNIQYAALMAMDILRRFLKSEYGNTERQIII